MIEALKEEHFREDRRMTKALKLDKTQGAVSDHELAIVSSSEKHQHLIRRA